MENPDVKIDSFEPTKESPKRYPQPKKEKTLTEKEINDLIYPDILKSFKEGIKGSKLDLEI